MQRDFRQNHARGSGSLEMFCVCWSFGWGIGGGLMEPAVLTSAVAHHEAGGALSIFG